MGVVAFVAGEAFDGSCVLVQGSSVAAVTHHRAMLAE